MQNMMSTRRPLGPRVKVEVTEAEINLSTQSNSSHCMIADAVRAAVPEAKQISVDISTIRWTDRSRGLRYVYLAPRVAQEALVDFDEGNLPAPFSFLLRNAHVLSAKQAAKKSSEKSAQHRKNLKRARLADSRHSDAKREVPRRIGGAAPPQLHTRREFGIRAFRAATVQRASAAAAREANQRKIAAEKN